MVKEQITLTFVLLLLLGCGGDETAVLPTQSAAITQTIMPTASNVPPIHLPAVNETPAAPPTAPLLSMETVVAQTRTAEQTNRPPRLNHY
ncbi:MAG: hypothetical protein KDE47_32710, partial [Caldilineaceae bacterium]|nr:hypothetical protein [Caldilineaceae bacterium]